MNDEEFKAAFASNLQKYREAAGMTQKQLGLAVTVGCSDESAARMIRKWENKTQLPSLQNTRKLSNALNCSIDDLIPG